MNIAVFGAGYVGLVQGAVLSDAGHNVTCIDIDEGRIENLKQAIIPIYEPGLKSLIKENHSLARLHFTTHAKKAVEENEIIFIAVGTPPEKEGWLRRSKARNGSCKNYRYLF